MAGERLACVWQAAYLKDPETTGQPRKSILQCLSTSFANQSPHLDFKPIIFDSTFKEKTIEFSTYKGFVFDHLKDKAAPLYIVEEEIEKLCWQICVPFYRLDEIKIPEERAFQLWQIFNKLVSEYVQPPKIGVDEAHWLTDRLIASLGQSVSKEDFNDFPDGLTFGSFLKLLDQKHLKDVTESVLEKCVDDLHQWLVKEVTLTGWLQKRTRKQANWTNWLKRWFILTPGKLTYYDSPKLKELKGEVAVTIHTKIESLADYKKSFRKYKSLFKLTNAPYLEIELSAEDDKDKRSWLTAVRDVIEAARAGTTPVRALLRERFNDKTPKKSSLSDLENRIKSIRVTQQSTNPRDVKTKAAALKQASAETNRSMPKQISEESNEEPPESFDNNFLAFQENKMKAVFSKLDTDGNGYVDENEFSKFISGLGVQMTDGEISLVFKNVDTNNNGKLSLTEFTNYFVDFITDETGRTTDVESRLRTAFLKADRDGTGTVDFKEFVEFAWERKRSVRVSRLLKTFQSMEGSDKGEVSYEQFRNFVSTQRNSIMETIVEDEDDTGSNDGCTIELKIKQLYHKADDDQLVNYLRDRWKGFVSFRRAGASGETVMKGAPGLVADFVPGEYNLVDLACFTDLPPLEPKYRVIKVSWEKAINQRSGRLRFPDDFDGVIPTDIATSEHLRYYGCSLADQNQVQVALLYRHAIQDFTYQNQYLQDYVTNPKGMGGSGIERHEFTHLDCPLDDDSGTFIMAKFIDKEETILHITGFKVPKRHTLYIPGGCIHSNDYLKGTWRTMLSDEAEIDHVQIMKRDQQGECQHFTFTFN